MDDQDLSGLDAENDEPSKTRLNIDQPYSLNPHASQALDDVLKAEQWIADIGVRAIVTGLGSSNTIEFMNGVRNLRRVLETQFAAGFAKGRQDQDLKWFMVGGAVGLALTSVGAVVLWSILS